MDILFQNCTLLCLYASFSPIHLLLFSNDGRIMGNQYQSKLWKSQSLVLIPDDFRESALLDCFYGFIKA